MAVNEQERFNKIKTFPDVQAFSGSDIMVIFAIPFTTKQFSTFDSIYKVSTEIQTLTISSTTSVLPVRRCGEVRAKYYTRGARSFAGSMVFTITNHDPFKEIFGLDPSRSNASENAWHIDQMPAFDIIVLANNELGGIGAQIIQNINIVNWGTTYSVDDMYTEYTYSYVAEHVTPFLATQYEIQNNVPEVEILAIEGRRQGNKTPDDLFARINGAPKLQPKNVRYLSKVSEVLDAVKQGFVNGNYSYNLSGSKKSSNLPIGLATITPSNTFIFTFDPSVPLQ
jgi:hypothetical protein